jgi:hypothetical protein
MSQNDSIRSKRRAGFSLASAVGGALAAAALGMGTAHADDTLLPDGYSDLYGAIGNANILPAQGAANAALDSQLIIQDGATGTTAASFDHAVDIFESSNVHAVADLINAIDPSAFALQADPDIVGTFNIAGDYLVPVDSLGYLAQSADFFLLDPTGLGFLLSPVIEILLGSPPF